MKSLFNRILLDDVQNCSGETASHALEPYAGWPAAKCVVRTHRRWLIISKEIPINYRGGDRDRPQGVQGESARWHGPAERRGPPDGDARTVNINTLNTQLCPAIGSHSVLMLNPQSSYLHTITAQAANPTEEGKQWSPERVN